MVLGTLAPWGREPDLPAHRGPALDACAPTGTHAPVQCAHRCARMVCTAGQAAWCAHTQLCRCPRRVSGDVLTPGHPVGTRALRACGAHVLGGPCTLQSPSHAAGTQRGDFPLVGLQGATQYILLEPPSALPMDAVTPSGWDVSLGDKSSQQVHQDHNCRDCNPQPCISPCALCRPNLAQPPPSYPSAHTVEQGPPCGTRVSARSCGGERRASVKGSGTYVGMFARR